MFTDNPLCKINKNNPAEMDRTGRKAYRVPIQFPVIACTSYLILLFFEKNSIKRRNKCGGANRCGVLDLIVKISSIRDHYRDEDGYTTSTLYQVPQQNVPLSL